MEAQTLAGPWELDGSQARSQRVFSRLVLKLRDTGPLLALTELQGSMLALSRRGFGSEAMRQPVRFVFTWGPHGFPWTGTMTIG